MKFGAGVLYKNLSSKCEFCENRPHDSHILRGVVSGLLYVFCDFLTVWVQSGVDLHVMPAKGRQYCDSLANSAYRWASMEFCRLSTFQSDLDKIRYGRCPQRGPRQLSRYSDSLRVGGSRERFPVGGEIFRTHSTPTFGPTKPPAQWATGYFRG